MSLEIATYVSQLDSSNPLSTDLRSQGDDHLRLIKAVLQASLPNLDRAFRIPTAVSLGSGVQSVLASHESALIQCDTTGANTNLFLPVSGIPAGFTIEVIKGSYDTNSVFVQPVSGSVFTKTGGFSRLRMAVPFERSTFYWNGSSWGRFDQGTQPGAIQLFAGGAPIGFQLANGALLNVADNPELFAIWGYTFGGGGATFQCPNLTDRFPVAAGFTYSVGALGGEVTHTLTAAEMPSHIHGVDLTSDAHSHGTGTGGNSGLVASVGSGASGAGPQYVNNGTLGTTSATVHIAGNTGSAGADSAHENRPPYFGINFGFRLC